MGKGGGTRREGGTERDLLSRRALIYGWEEHHNITLPVGRRAAARNRAEKPKPVGTGPGWRCNIPDVGKRRLVVLRRVLEAVIHIHA